MVKPIFPKTHCKHGHEFTKENTYVKPNGTRACKSCTKIRKITYNKIYKYKNRDNIITKQNIDYKNNPEKYADYRKNWLEKHLYDKTFREKQRSDTRKLHRKLKEKMFEILGDKCIKCGFTDKRALQFDHINGDGKLDRKRFKATQFYRYYILHQEEAKKRLQILCANCNYIKRIENWEFKKPKYQNLIEREMAIES